MSASVIDLASAIRRVGKRTSAVEEQLAAIVNDLQNLRTVVSSHPEMVPKHITDVEMSHVLQLLKRVSAGYDMWLRNATGEALVELAEMFDPSGKLDDIPDEPDDEQYCGGCGICGYVDPEGRPVGTCPNCGSGE